MPDWLRALLGTGLVAGSVATDQESGEITQARQYLRNIFTSPDEFAGGLAGHVAGLSSLYDPVLRQEENKVLDQVQQRVIAGRPTSLSTSMGGPEVSGLRRASEDVLVPRRQAHFADLGLQALNRQTGAAGTILATAAPNANSQALAQLAAMLMG